MVPASAALSGYQAMAAPLQKKVKITDVKAMFVQAHTQTNLVKIETDAGITGIGEAYWGRGVKEVILGYLRDLVVGRIHWISNRFAPRCFVPKGGGLTGGSDGNRDQRR